MPITASAIDLDFTTIVISLMGGGVVSAVAIAFKMKPERDLLVVQKEEKQVVINAQFIDDYDQTIQMLRMEMRELRDSFAGERALRRKAEDDLYIQLERVRHLESELKRLTDSK